jgi:hypothetical protein
MVKMTIIIPIILLFSASSALFSQDIKKSHIRSQNENIPPKLRQMGGIPNLNINQKEEEIALVKSLKFNTGIQDIINTLGQPQRLQKDSYVYEFITFDKVTTGKNTTIFTYSIIFKLDAGGTKLNRVTICERGSGPAIVIYDRGMTENEFSDFIRKIKELSVGNETADDIFRKTEITWTRKKTIDGEIWSYSEKINSEVILISLDLGKNDKLASVTVSKGADVIYHKSQEQQVKKTESKENDITNSINSSESLPENAVEGNICYNKKDKHFYGWNGNEWLQLDNPKN